MPYGVARDVGGDSVENVAKVESCVKQNVARGMPKLNAIRICKKSVQDAARKRRGRG